MATAELATYARELRWVLQEIARILVTLPASAIDWRPDTGSANSACAIAAHVLGSTRVYVLGFACGLTIERDRDAEFASRGVPAAELVARLRLLEDEIASALGALAPAALERRFVPPQHLWGTGEPREISARDAIVEAIRHASIHLGEIRLTRSLADASTP